MKNPDDMKSVFPTRLVIARKMAGLSLQGLADKLGNIITKQSLSKYEQGMMNPNSDVLIKLSRALNVTIDFFFSKPSVNVELSEVDFRRYSSKLTKPMRGSIQLKVKDVFERYNQLETILGINEETVLFDYKKIVRTKADAEEAAKELRKQWDLGNDPISDVVELLEDKGYKVIEIDAPDGFDGMKASFRDKKLIVVKKIKSDADVVRKRFTALHELGHHNIKFPARTDEKEQEKLCHIFACAFLFPGEMARYELNRERFHFYERELIILKEKWGISFSAVFARALELDIISLNTYKKFNIKYRERLYHKPDNEPGRFMSNEKPTRMEKLIFQGLARGVLSLNEAAHLAGISGWEMRKQMLMIV